MNYLVMDCHPGYAVVLDDAGRFLRVANLHYEVGQTVSFVIEMQAPKTSRAGGKKWAVSIVSVAACLCIAVLGVWQYFSTPYGSVRMQINPDVLLSVSRLDYVVDLEGLNKDGQNLIDGYQYRSKKVEQVADDLADLAVEQGYLTEGGAIHLTVESEDEDWRVVTEDRILLELEVHLGGSVAVSAASAVPDALPARPNTPDTAPQPEVSQPPQSNTIVIPITPNDSGDSGYDDTDYGPNNDGVTDYDDMDHGPNNDGVTDYDDAAEDGGTAYDSTAPDDADNVDDDPDNTILDDVDDDTDDSDIDDAVPDDSSDDADDDSASNNTSDDSSPDDGSGDADDDIGSDDNTSDDSGSNDGDSGYSDDSDSDDDSDD